VAICVLSIIMCAVLCVVMLAATASHATKTFYLLLI